MSLLDKRIAWVLACLFLWVGQIQAAPQKNVVLLLSGDSEPYLDVEAGIQSVIDQSSPNIKLRKVFLEHVDQSTFFQPGENDLLVAVGTRATEYALTKAPPSLVFSTFVTRNSLLSAISEDGETGSVFPERLRRAVVLDQPAQRVISLVKLIAPEVAKLGTVVNGSAPNRLSEFKKAIEGEQLGLEVAELFNDSNPIKDLKRVFSVSDVFVVIPDRSRFNSKVAKWILFLSYRHRVPVIGYSEKYTDAGALISLYTSPFQIGRDTGEQLVEMFLAGKADSSAATIQYPRYFNLAVNDTVADSLGIKVGDKKMLKQSITEMEVGNGMGINNE